MCNSHSRWHFLLKSCFTIQIFQEHRSKCSNNKKSCSRVPLGRLNTIKLDLNGHSFQSMTFNLKLLNIRCYFQWLKYILYSFCNRIFSNHIKYLEIWLVKISNNKKWHIEWSKLVKTFYQINDFLSFVIYRSLVNKTLLIISWCCKRKLHLLITKTRTYLHSCSL